MDYLAHAAQTHGWRLHRGPEEAQKGRDPKPRRDHMANSRAREIVQRLVNKGVSEGRGREPGNALWLALTGSRPTPAWKPDSQMGGQGDDSIA